MENLKAKIQAILMNSSQKSVIGWAVEEDDFEAVAEEIVKKCFVHSVSNRRELLIAFAKFCRSELPLSLFDSVEQNVDRFDGNL